MKRHGQDDISKKVRVARVRVRLADVEWNFGGVPDAELVACCCWEYAREAASIRDAVEIAKSAFANQGIPQLESENRETFRAAANQAFGLLVQTGFDIAFWVGQPFPEPWQSMGKTERDKWANVRPKIPTPVEFPPFRVTDDLCIAGALHGEAKKVHEARRGLHWRLSQNDSGVANLKEAAELRKQLSGQGGNSTPVVVRGMGGADSFITQINWRDFTDKEIVAGFERWVKSNRPTTPDTKQLLGRRDDKGRKLNDWRVMLDRLSIMRLLHISTKTQMSAKALSHYPSADWYRERKNANRDFHRLFSFLSDAEFPLSWLTKGSRR